GGCSHGVKDGGDGTACVGAKAWGVAGGSEGGAAWSVDGCVGCGCGCDAGATGSKEGAVSRAPASAISGLPEPVSTSFGDTISTVIGSNGAESNGFVPAKMRPNVRIAIWPMHDMANPEPMNSFGLIFQVNVVDARWPPV